MATVTRTRWWRCGRCWGYVVKTGGLGLMTIENYHWKHG